MNKQSENVEPLLDKTAAAILLKFALAAFVVLGLGVALIEFLTREPPNNQTTAITEVSAPVALSKDVLKPPVVECGGAKSQMSFEKTPENGVAYLITVSRGGKTFVKTFDANDYTEMICQRSKSGRDLIVYQSICGGSACSDPDFIGIVDPLSLQELIAPKKENISKALAVLGDYPESAPNSVSYMAVEEALYSYHDVKSALLDGQNSVGKNIHLNATYRKLSVSQGRPILLVDVDTDTSLNYWEVLFADRFTNSVKALKPDQRLAITCKILALNGLAPKCEIIRGL